MKRTKEQERMLRGKRAQFKEKQRKRDEKLKDVFSPIVRGRIQKGYNLGDEMDRLLAWLYVVETSYEWRGREFFNGEAYAREMTAKETARDFRKAILETQNIVDRIPDRYVTERHYTSQDEYTTTTRKIGKPAWKGPLFYRLRHLLGNVQKALDDLIQLDYEDAGYSMGASTTAAWRDMYNKIMDTIREYQKELEAAYIDKAEAEQKKADTQQKRIHLDMSLFRNNAANGGDDFEDLPF